MNYMAEYQRVTHIWLEECFGKAIANSPVERNLRFLEEALELVQANGLTQEDAHALVDYVFKRPAGEIKQETGGVLICLFALCNVVGVDAHTAFEMELARAWHNISAIREKQKNKPQRADL